MHPCNVFTHNTQNFLLLLIHVQVQCDFAITRDTCVDVYSLNCLHLFLKYKIGQICLVCVRVLDHECFAFFLLRDVFESLKFCLDLWLSSLLDCIHFCVFFLSLKNCFFIQFNNFSTNPRQIAIYRDPWISFLDRSYRIFDPSSYLEFVSIASRQILNPSRKFLFGQQLLNIYRDLVLDRSSIH